MGLLRRVGLVGRPKVAYGTRAHVVKSNVLANDLLRTAGCGAHEQE